MMMDDAGGSYQLSLPSHFSSAEEEGFTLKKPKDSCYCDEVVVVVPQTPHSTTSTKPWERPVISDEDEATDQVDAETVHHVHHDDVTFHNLRCYDSHDSSGEESASSTLTTSWSSSMHKHKWKDLVTVAEEQFSQLVNEEEKRAAKIRKPSRKVDIAKAEKAAKREEVCLRQRPIKVAMVAWALAVMEDIEPGSGEKFVRTLEDDEVTALVEEPAIAWAFHGGRMMMLDARDEATRITRKIIGYNEKLDYDREAFLTMVSDSLADADKRKPLDEVWSPVVNKAWAYLEDLSQCLAKYSRLVPSMHVTRKGRNLEWCEPSTATAGATRKDVSSSSPSTTTTTTTSGRNACGKKGARVPVVVNVKIMEDHRTTDIDVIPDEMPLDKAGRIKVLMDLVTSKPLSDRVEVVDSYLPVDNDSLLHCTSPSYVFELHALSSVCEANTGPSFKLGQDTFFSQGTLRAAKYSAGGAMEGVFRVYNGAKAALCLLRPAGHHSCSRGIHPSPGHCFFNNVAIAAEYARRQLGFERIAVVDFDIHHGNGTEDDVRAINKLEDSLVMHYFSIHTQMGYPVNGPGKSKNGNKSMPEEGIYNHPLPNLTKAAFHEAMDHIGRIMANVRPNLIFISAGFDGHKDDPVGSYLDSEWDDDDYRLATRKIMDMARLSQCPVVSCLEGGYNPEGGSRSPLARAWAVHAEEIVNMAADSSYVVKVPDPDEVAYKKKQQEDDDDEEEDDEDEED